jgi:hypothetical protein
MDKFISKGAVRQAHCWLLEWSGRHFRKVDEMIPDVKKTGRSPVALYIAWWSLAALILGVDFWIGPRVQFPILFVIPVGLAAWWNGLAGSIVLALLLPAIRTSFWIEHFDRDELLILVINMAIRMGVLLFIALLVVRMHRLLLENRKLTALLPLCSRCRRIRDDAGEWHSLESYKLGFQLCPDCASRYDSGVSFAASPPKVNKPGT